MYLFFHAYHFHQPLVKQDGAGLLRLDISDHWMGRIDKIVERIGDERGGYFHQQVLTFLSKGVAGLARNVDLGVPGFR